MSHRAKTHKGAHVCVCVCILAFDPTHVDYISPPMC